MNEMIILDKPIRQVNGLYCLNDLHKASGGKETDKPVYWLKSKQLIELIEELNKVRILTLEQNQQVIKTVKGGNQAGTYACRELVLAYATWISPRFFLLVLRTFDLVARGGMLAVGKIQPIADYPPPAPWQPEPVLPRPPRNLAEARTLFEQIDHAEKHIESEFNSIVVQRSQLHAINRMTRTWREYWLTVENDQ
ncbi:KilA-N domain-containing protein [Simonsiella muelleri]|uniref:KilA-N domain-containing protein n=1 Tax=Simonsiella muelleri ATCC 29453 TaxID=641147 RepID=V9HL00_9NEIS|nr:KilA-N domain-containing protein [Simonsiella muelleri]AUX61456.1 hypothetical protein BWP33_06305 [Simonsiella muelleri ATCC 29453]EFG29959.2 hypothetical protein HMPREF9021_02220 [Simonsiella muelleri ATCC 29453]UBQ53510.1 KilA-N domain-containing protein [Simonsiella muelleri]